MFQEKSEDNSEEKYELPLTDLPPDFWHEILNHLHATDILSIRNTSQSMFQMFQPVQPLHDLHDELLTKIALTYVVEGNVKGLIELIGRRPDILFSKGKVKDPRGYTRYGSPYQLMKFLCDDDMLINHIAELDSVKGYEQLREKCQQQDKELGSGGADLIKLDFKPQTCNPQSKDFKAIAEFKTHYTLFDDTVHEVTFPLLENKDGLLYYKDDNQVHHFYYANPEKKTIEEIGTFDDEELEKNPDVKAFINSFDDMELNSSRRSSDAEHQLIENLFHRRLQREGIVYEHNGITYRDSHSSFEIINAYRKCVRLYQEAENNGEWGEWDKAHACWRNDVRCRQGEEIWILERICEKRSWYPLPDNFKGFKRTYEFYDYTKRDDVSALVKGQLVGGLLDGSFALYRLVARRCGRLAGGACAVGAAACALNLIAVNRLVKDGKANIVEFNLEQHSDLQLSSTHSP